MTQEVEKGKRYKIVVDYGWNGSKRLRHIEIFYGGKRDAQLRENQLKQQIKDGSYVKKVDMTVADLSKEYLKIKKNEVVSTTYTKYEYCIKVINDRIGYVKLQKLNARMIDSFYDYLYNEYVSPRTGKQISSTSIQHYYLIINNMLNQAMQWDYIKSNPNSKCKKPKRTRTRVEAYSIEEVHKLLEALKNEPIKYQALIYLALDTGCRRRRNARFNGK